MFREKTALEMKETAQEQADRLRDALFVASNAPDFRKAKSIMKKAMAGELHGNEPKKLDFGDFRWKE